MYDGEGEDAPELTRVDGNGGSLTGASFRTAIWNIEFPIISNSSGVRALKSGRCIGITGTVAPADPYDCTESSSVRIQLESDTSVEGTGFSATVRCIGGDSCGQIDEIAVPLNIDGPPVQGSVEVVGGGAWYSFVGIEGDSYQFDGQPGTEPRLSSVMVRIVDTDQVTELAATDQESGAAHLEWTCTSNGRFYIEVGGHESETGNFALSLIHVVPDADPCSEDGATFAPQGIDAETIVLEPESGSYDSDLRCHWRITCVCGTPRVDVTHLATESGFDFVEIYDGDEWPDGLPGHQISGEWEDQEITTFDSSADPQGGGSMVVQFTSDGSVAAGGFQADLSCHDAESCVGKECSTCAVHVATQY
eukprot:SAG31_NODE_2444_length_5683_cov_2.031160_3_plen_363_part_00